MQELIERLKEERDLHGYERGLHYETAIEFAESLLEKEKEVMCEFQDKANYTDFWVKYEGSEECFNKTFNTKER